MSLVVRKLGADPTANLEEGEPGIVVVVSALILLQREERDQLVHKLR